MRKHCFGLMVSLLISGVIAAGAGICMKANLPEEYAYYQSHNAVALPFVLMADGNFLTILEAERSAIMAEPETTPVDATSEAVLDTEPSAESTEAATELWTAQTTEATSEPTVAENKESETQEGVADSTEPPNEPDTTEATQAPTEPVVLVDESYFDDTLFIGDSRMCGLRDFARMGHADYFCDVGMTVFNLWERNATDYDYGTKKLTGLLNMISYGKIYIALGINEAGYPMKNFETEYEKLIQTIRQAQPDAIIILQSVMAVTEGYADGRSYFLPEHLAQMNAYIASFADNETIFYIDVNEAVADENGFLLTDLTNDGCHLYAKKVAVWADWLRSKVPQM